MDISKSLAARLGTRLAFLVAGFGVSCWAALIPFAKERLQVDDGTLGLLLLCLGIGSVLAMLKTGLLCAQYGCKPVMLVSGWAMVLLLPALAGISAMWLMAIALFVFGGALGSLDVAMNVHAVEVEKLSDRPLMSGFHALFSVGGFAGATFMTFLMSLSLTPFNSAWIGATLMAAAMLMSAPRLLAASTSPKESTGTSMLLPRGPVLLLAALAAVTFLVEGSLLDWSALLLTDTGLTPANKAGVGYALFSVAMTIGRLTGDRITARFGDYAVMFWGGVAAVLGFVLLLLVPRIEAAMLAFVLIGLGASNVVPVLFRKAGAQSSMPAALAVSAVTTAGYAGYLTGPAGLGFVSKVAGLPAAFWILAGLMCLVPVFAKRVTSPATARTATT